MATFGEVLNRARQLLGAGDLAEAQRFYRQLVEAVPQAAEPWHELGILQLQAGRPEGAVECLRQAVTLDPGSATYHVNLATTYRMLKRPDEAIESFERALKLGSPTAELYNNLALSLKDTGQTEAALRAFDDALRLRPDYANGHFNRGNLLLDLGRLEEAAESYQRAIDARGDDAVAHCKLGMVECDLERWDRAVACFRRALELEPDFSEAYSNLAVALTQQTKWDEAAACCRRALELKPDSADAHNNLGAVFEKQGQFAEAAACWRRALELKPDYAEVHNNLGAALEKQGQLDEAAACWRRALELAPDYVAACGNLGAVLEKQGQLDAAAACWRRTLELKPDYAEAHNNLAAILAKQEKYDEAAACLRRALELKPDFAAALHNFGGVLAKQENFDEAVACWRRALELKPDFAGASSNLGIQLTQLGRLAEAKACYLKALELHPTQHVWELNILSLCPSVFHSSQDIELYRRTLLGEVEDFCNTEPLFDRADLATAACAPSFNLQFHGHNDRAIREAYGRLYRNCFPTEIPAGSSGRPRIGFVVTDWHEHGFVKSLGGVLDRLNPDLFELVIMGSDRGIGTLRSAIRNQAIRLLALPDKLDQIADVIRAAQCDLLYYWEVGTDSTNYCLPFFRLAPRQCTSWGIQVTSGIPQLDYYLSSELVEAEDAQNHYTEKLVLARTLLTYQQRASIGNSPQSREHFGIMPEWHVYLCAQQLGKFHPDFDAILAGILRQDAKGVVVVTADRRSAFIANQLRERFATAMPDVVDRIVFIPLQPMPDYLSLIAAADVLLDPLHFGGVNSSYDGFSLNQPIVTLPSRFQRGRYTLACYKKMGLSDCVASNPRQYMDIAVALGSDAPFRSEVVKKIRRASPVLFEDMEAVREHERIFSALVEESRSTRRPDTV